jgi:tRNA pseudouridine55 synthase
MLGLQGDALDLRVLCSKGTYIRTLVEDIGAALGCGAHLAGLRRIAASGFRVEEAATLDAIQAADEAGRDRFLLPVERLLGDLPRLELPEPLASRFASGQAIALAQTAPGCYQVHRAGGGLLGVADADADGRLRPRRLLAARPETAQAADKHRKNL